MDVRNPTGCPSDEELRTFAVGDLTDAALERLASHVTGCARCEEALARLDGSADELVSRLRGLPAGNGSSHGRVDVPEPLLHAARGMRKGGSDLVVDPGKHIAHQLEEAPQRFERFEILEELGVGSFGYVFKAHDTELDRIVALKVQRGLATHGEASEEKDRFLREARSAAQLEHPGIVSLYQSGENEDGVCYLVTEYVCGTTLEQRIHDDRPDAAVSARLVAEIADALHYAHTHGVIHRDVKPSNVMLDDNGRPHVMDFGLAKREFGEATVTSDGRVLGTPAYMSPELARGESHHVDGRSDVYSLGVVLYELLTGERPFQGNRRMLVLQVLEDDPRPPRRLNEGIHRDLETICLKAMSKSPGARYPSCRAFADDLRRFLRNEPIHARPIGPVERLARWTRRNPAAASIFLAVVFVAAFGFWHLSRLTSELVHSSAVDSAAQYAEMLETVNELYSSEIVQRVGDHGIAATADYALNDAEIPLPATLLTELLEAISGGDSGMRGRHYSEYPFRTPHRRRAAGRLRVGRPAPPQGEPRGALRLLRDPRRPPGAAPRHRAHHAAELRRLSQQPPGQHLHRLEGRRRARDPRDRAAAGQRPETRARGSARVVHPRGSRVGRPARRERRRARHRRPPPARAPGGGALSTGRVDTSTSRSLLDRARADDAAAWDRLVDLFAPFVWQCCRSKLPPEDAADVFQEVFQAAAARIDTFEKRRPGDSFRGWLRTIARNKVNDHFRRLEREPRGVGGTELQLRLNEVPAPELASEVSATSNAPVDEAADRQADQQLFHDALDQVRPHFHENTWRAFWMTVVDGRTPAHVAEELGMRPGAVRVAKSRVLGRLRSELGELLG